MGRNCVCEGGEVWFVGVVAYFLFFIFVHGGKENKEMKKKKKR